MRIITSLFQVKICCYILINVQLSLISPCYTAPTGAGKTVLMELAVIRVLLNHGSDSKVIYMAPTKSLCAERVKDWEQKFGPFGIKCMISVKN